MERIARRIGRSAASSGWEANRVDEPRAKRPWWRRKRTWTAAFVALLVWYPVSSGPYEYVRGRNGGCGILGNDPMDRIGAYEPVVVGFQAVDSFGGRFGCSPQVYPSWTAYNRACVDAGRAARRAASH
jgi:hypothetical protein